MVYYLDRYRIICIVLLFIIAAAAVISVYNASGVGWDFLSRYLNGRTIATGHLNHPAAFTNKVPAAVNLLGAGLEFNVTPALSIAKGFYFDQVWEPLPSLIMAGFIVLAKGFAIGAYLIFLLVLLLAASLMTAKSFDLDPLLVYALLMSPFVVGMTTIGRLEPFSIIGRSLSSTPHVIPSILSRSFLTASATSSPGYFSVAFWMRGATVSLRLRYCSR